MAAQRPIILEALRDLLDSEVVDVDGRICFPWDAKINPEDGPLLQIAMGDSMVDDNETMGKWLHQIRIKIGAVIAGAFDYPAAWDVLADVSDAIATDYTLGGTCDYATITGCGDFLDIAGDKIMWPHLDATITYTTPRGAL